ncbi:MAG: hypothetical protein KatS3mg023_3657 [Armatimonadota bacterium]|nr:MAG: hypothetical protein KatS3mg023_3657 [Armatimonadota bacterium]
MNVRRTCLRFIRHVYDRYPLVQPEHRVLYNRDGIKFVCEPPHEAYRFEAPKFYMVRDNMYRPLTILDDADTEDWGFLAPAFGNIRKLQRRWYREWERVYRSEYEYIPQVLELLDRLRRQMHRPLVVQLLDHNFRLPERLDDVSYRSVVRYATQWIPVAMYLLYRGEPLTLEAEGVVVTIKPDDYALMFDAHQPAFHVGIERSDSRLPSFMMCSSSSKLVWVYSFDIGKIDIHFLSAIFHRRLSRLVLPLQMLLDGQLLSEDPHRSPRYFLGGP